MDFISIGIGVIGITSTLLFKSISYIRGCDRSMAAIQLQLKDHIIDSSTSMAEIRIDIAKMQHQIETIGGVHGPTH